jgi:hypothetical protein
MNNSFSLLPLLIALSVGLAPLSATGANEGGGGAEVATKKEIERIYENFADISRVLCRRLRAAGLPTTSV